MTHIKNIFLIVFMMFIGFSCSNLEEDNVELQDPTLRRMPFNQRVFLLNSKVVSEIFEINYDFQGLTGDATLSKLPLTRNGESFDLPRGGHMTVDPTKSYIVISITSNNAVWTVNLTPNAEGLHEVKRLPFATRPGGITQVDFDEDDYLFLAGKGGFFRVSTLGGDNKIWDLNDGESVSVSKFTFNSEIELGDEGEDGEDYFNDIDNNSSDYAFLSAMQRRIDNGKFRFAGGDITFTQNADESGGFEQERLITFTQWGNMAAQIGLEFNRSGMNYNAKALFRVRKVTNQNGKGTHKVTGGALMGDNLLITSHHFTDDFSVWNMTGEELARPKIKFSGTPAFNVHNWGDMATTQTFDGNISNDDRIIGEDAPYYPYFDGAQMAEVKLYRPGSKVTDNYDVSDDNPGVSLEARRNAANSDIADIRVKPYKFASLGGGEMVLKFPNTVTVGENTKLQVVETSWNKLPTYEDKQAAFRAYGEKASVYVSDYPGKYYGSWANDESNWTKVGDAYISSNVYDLDGISQFSWVRIVDDSSITPDGFDVNYVAAFEDVPAPTLNPFCTNETVTIPQEELDNKAPVRLTAMGIYVEGDESSADEALPKGYRWRLRNNTDSEITVTWEITRPALSGTLTIPARNEVYFSTPVGGNMRVVLDGNQVDAIGHSGDSINILDNCGGEDDGDGDGGDGGPF